MGSPRWREENVKSRLFFFFEMKVFKIEKKLFILAFSKLSFLFKCKTVEGGKTTILELEICAVPKMENIVGMYTIVYVFILINYFMSSEKPP